MSSDIWEILRQMTHEMSISDMRSFKNEINDFMDKRISQAVSQHNNKLTSTIHRNSLIVEAYLNGEKPIKLAKQFNLNTNQVNRIIERQKNHFLRHASNIDPAIVKEFLYPKTITPELKEKFLGFCRTIYTHINQFARSQGFRELAAPELDMPIIETDLPMYIRKNLIEQGYTNFCEIAILSSSELKAIPNLGRKAVTTIEELVAKKKSTAQ